MESSELELTAESVRDRLENDESLTLLDIRKPREREVATLSNDVWIPMEEVPENLDSIAEKDRPLIIYCHHGMRSMKVTQYLREEGLDDVYSLAGGIDYWARKIDPEMNRY
ncbi:MAG: rhodanese-like domain-containing protein [bacterium]